MDDWARVFFHLFKRRYFDSFPFAIFEQRLLMSILLPFVCVIALVMSSLVLLNPLARKLDLVDQADGDRKLSRLRAPLTGGLALYIALMVTLDVFDLGKVAVPYPQDFWPIVSILLGILVVVHVLDDFFSISALVRLVMDSIVGALLCTVALVQLDTLGYLFGNEELTLGRWSVVMTVFCFVAASNAFNMTDGIDSLCTGMGIICFSSVILLLLEAGNPDAYPMVTLCSLLVMSLVPLYFANLGWFGSGLRTFLGDSGARLIGFLAAIILIYSASQSYIDPVIAYFPIAVPVCDCLILMGVRVMDRRSPLSADRLHLHHLIMDLGISVSTTRFLILLLAAGFTLLGLMLQHFAVQEWIVSVVIVVSFWCFIGMRWQLQRMAPLYGTTAKQVS